MSFVSFIKENAEKAGWPSVKVLSDSCVTLPFDTDEGDINIFIRPCGKLFDKTVLEFSGPDIPVPSDVDLKLSMLEAFMKRNGDLLQGHWAIEGGEDDPKFSVMVTQIAETMDPLEFKSAVNTVLKEHERFLAILRKATKGSNVDF
ncbi:MAG: hypothetical protein PHQ19_03600 [Candidatus Krumholzibacteria bacterium]|nr:hypothetical protein [Candidatus Krumholzibacteria bacterium]